MTAQRWICRSDERSLWLDSGGQNQQNETEKMEMLEEVRDFDRTRQNEEKEKLKEKYKRSLKLLSLQNYIFEKEM